MFSVHRIKHEKPIKFFFSRNASFSCFLMVPVSIIPVPDSIVIFYYSSLLFSLSFIINFFPCLSESFLVYFSPWSIMWDCSTLLALLQSDCKESYWALSSLFLHLSLSFSSSCLILDITLCLLRTYCKAMQSRLSITGFHPKSHILYKKHGHGLWRQSVITCSGQRLVWLVIFKVCLSCLCDPRPI